MSTSRPCSLRETAGSRYGALAVAALLAAVAAGSARSANALLRASWPRRSPAAAISLWQALGLASGLAADGALLAAGVAGQDTQHAGVLGGLTTIARRLAAGHAIDPHQALLLIAVRAVMLTAGLALLTVLCLVLVMAFSDAIGARRRQRALLSLLAHGDPKAPGALVIDYPAGGRVLPAGHSLPDRRQRRDARPACPAELAAVLAHERAHLRARHDLVLIPFTSLRRAFPGPG